ANDVHWGLAILGAVLALSGAVLAIGGVRLIVAGGSWYYALAGVGLLIAGVQLARRKRSGAAWFALVFIATFFWSAWESGLDYWRWVPRFGLMVLFAFCVALLSPALERGPSKTVSRTLAGVFGIVFLGAFALAFLPYHIT